VRSTPARRAGGRVDPQRAQPFEAHLSSPAGRQTEGLAMARRPIFRPRNSKLVFLYTDKKENQIFLIYKEIQNGAVAKSYMRKGFLIYVEMRKYFPIYEEAVSHIWLCNCSTLNFLICE
jgi:hypothetical protein